MQIENTIELEIEHLLFNLMSTVNELQGYRRFLSINHVQQADISLQKLNALMTNAKHPIQPFKLSLV